VGKNIVKGLVPVTALAVLAGVLVVPLGPGALQAREIDPDAPVPPGSKFQILDLKYQTQPVAGAVQALEVKETATEIRIEMPADVLFDFDKAEIRPDAAQVLAEAARLLRPHARRRIVIEGHTDAKGNDQYNQQLSERRAQAVKQWLQEHEKLKNMTLETRGFGSKRPVTPNTKPDGTDDPEGRQKNRRVEIVVTKQAQGGGAR
jgi:outer membrane protein OmpA-like peptidoglycan-associated protein